MGAATEPRFDAGRTVGVVAVGLLVISGSIHLWLAPEHYAEASYLGILFGLEFVGAVIAAVGVSRNRTWGWILGSVVVLGAIGAYVIRGTIGLPLVESEGLFEPVGLVTKSVELLFIVVAAYWWTAIRRRTGPSRLS